MSPLTDQVLVIQHIQVIHELRRIVNSFSLNGWLKTLETPRDIDYVTGSGNDPHTPFSLA